MLTTNDNSDLNVTYNDSTVYISPGSARIGNNVRYFRGGIETFNSIANFDGDTSSYQNAALYLQYTGQEVDTSRAVSATESSQRDLVYPELPFDGTNEYGHYHPLALFTFWSSDGTNAELVDMHKVN